MLICITLIFLISMTASFAATDENVQLNTTKTDEISLDDKSNDELLQEENEQIDKNDELVAVGGGGEDKLAETPGSFTDLITLYSNSDDSMELNRNYTWNYDDQSDNIIIDKEFTVNGNGNTIDAKSNNHGALGIFYIKTSSKVIFNNIIFTGFRNHAVYFKLDANFEFNKCTFINNIFMTPDEGAAIYFADKVTQGTFNNVNFTHNQIKGGGSDSYGGAIYYQGNVENTSYINCDFTDNFVSGKGGAIYIGGNSIGNTYVNTTFRIIKSKVLNILVVEPFMLMGNPQMTNMTM